MSIITILAPFDGWCVALEEVPDPVFAGRMLGEGLAIDPTSGIVLAPCAGTVVTLPTSAHAVSIRTPEGADVLVHIGIDTVHLGGRGFAARVELGQTVRPGQELIRFDLDLVARHAKSLLTPIVVAAKDGMTMRHRHATGTTRAGDALFDIAHDEMISGTPIAATSASDHAMPATGSVTVERNVVVRLIQGLHARPAALLSQAAKQVSAEVSILAHGRTINARSVTEIMASGIRHGEEIIIRARGAGAAQAINQIDAALERALQLEAAAGHQPRSGRPAAAEAGAFASSAAASADDSAEAASGVLVGVTAVAGFSVGRATRIERREVEVVEQGSGIAHESTELERARANVRSRLARVGATGGETRRAIVDAHIEFLDDPAVNEVAQEYIAAGKSAGYAWRAAIRRQVRALEALGDVRLRERADDLLDVESHILLALQGEARPMNLNIPERAVIVAEDLLPSELTALDGQRLAALCLARGGSTSHVAILAAAMNVPM
ncbi:MAG: ptsP, partial [Gammaproteobacteria bacterium]|nr:ptsP [Gammaproteobacteria bacterium]